MAEPTGAFEAPSDLDLAREEFDLTCFWEAMTSSDLEAAYMTGDKDRQRRLNDRIGVTSRVKRHAYDRWMDAQRAAAPSFEQMLADPTLQFDRDGEVARSVLDYGRGKVCMTPMQVRSNTASVGAVVPSSVYLCTQPTPCPTHANGDEVSVDPAAGGDGA